MGVKFNPLIFSGLDLTGGGANPPILPPVPTVNDLPPTAQDGYVVVTLDTDEIWVYDADSGRWVNVGLRASDLFGNTPNAIGYDLVLDDSVPGQRTRELVLQPADASSPGAVSTEDQTFAGAKTFVDLVTTNSGLETLGTIQMNENDILDANAISRSVPGNISIEAQDGGLTFEAQNGDIALNAPAGQLNVITDSTINITSNSDSISLSAVNGAINLIGNDFDGQFNAGQFNVNATNVQFNASGQIGLDSQTALTISSQGSTGVSGASLSFSSGDQIVDMGIARLTQVLDPVNPDDAATMNYVDTAIGTLGPLKANIELDNLGTTAINADLLPDTDLTRALGSPSDRWNAVYTQTVDAQATAMTVTGNTVTMYSTAGNTNFVGPGSVLLIGDGTNAKSLVMTDKDNNFSVNLKAPDTLAATTNYTLPATDGGSGDGLTTDGAGNLSWNTPVVGANTSLSNLSPTSINASLVPGSDDTLDLGDNFNQWRIVYGRLFLGDNGTTAFGSNFNTGNEASFETGSSNTAANVNTATLRSGDNISGSSGLAGNVVVKSGSISEATNANNTGDVLIQIGTTTGAGARGSIKLQDGSEGTIGHVWTSTDTAGAGAWVASQTATKTAPTVQRFTTGSGTYNKNYAFTITSGSATTGATYTNNGVTFTVYATVASATLVYLNGNGPPTTSGTLTKTTGTGDATLTFTSFLAPNYLRVKLVGGGGAGGGGGQASSAGSGASGASSSFGTSLLTASGGNGTVTGSAGGSATVNAPAIAVFALNGIGTSFNAVGTSNTTYVRGEPGGSIGGLAGYGAGGINGAGTAGAANTGAGGGGGGSNAANLPAIEKWGGAGGGSGAYIDAIIPSPSATYAYVVGAGGATGGTAGTNGFAGGTGGSGFVSVEEYY